MPSSPHSVRPVTDAGGGRLADVPPSPWLHSKYWVASRSVTQRLPDTHPLLGVHVEVPSGRDHVWQADLGTEMMPWLADHKVNGQAVMPAAVFAEMALAAGREVLGLPVDAVQVNELEVEQPLALDRQTRVTTQLAQSDNGIRVEIYASSAGDKWSRHAVASVGTWTRGWPRRRSDAQRFGDRNRAARRRCRPSGLLHSSADPRCGAAASRCRPCRLDRRKIEPRPRICRCHSRRSGCSGRSDGGPGAAPSW